MSGVRIGQGYDVHAFSAAGARPLVLGGVEVPFDRGLEGHSDGDALLHAIADACLGALGAGDLGRHFPSSDEGVAGADSAGLLERVVALVADGGYRLGNLDATVVAQVPRLASHQPAMAARIAALLRADGSRVNLKVTSTDHLGAIGREEGIAAMAVVLLEPDASREGGSRGSAR